MHVQYVVNDQGKKTGVFLTIEDYEHLIEQLEDTEDIRAVALAKSEPDDFIPWDEAKKELGL